MAKPYCGQQLAAKLKKVCLVLHSQALERVCRSAGYSGYYEAIRQPRSIAIPFEEWRARLSRQFDLPEDDLLAPDEFAFWYEKLFVPRGRKNLEARDANSREEARLRPIAQHKSEEKIPEFVHHEKTLVDEITSRARRRR